MRTTKYTNKGMFRTINGHEWRVQGDSEPRNTRTTRKKSRGLLNHERTRMDTNVVARVIQNHETHDTKIEQRVIEPRMDTNGHE